MCSHTELHSVTQSEGQKCHALKGNHHQSCFLSLYLKKNKTTSQHFEEKKKTGAAGWLTFVCSAFCILCQESPIQDKIILKQNQFSQRPYNLKNRILQKRGLHTAFLFVTRQMYLRKLKQHNQYLICKKTPKPINSHTNYTPLLLHLSYVYNFNSKIQHTFGVTGSITLMEETC